MQVLQGKRPEVEQTELAPPTSMFLKQQLAKYLKLLNPFNVKQDTLKSEHTERLKERICFIV